MANHLRNNDPTPNGGAYSEIWFFDDAGNSVDEEEATRFVIRECNANGETIKENWGFV